MTNILTLSNLTPDPLVQAAHAKGNVVVFFDIAVQEKHIGRLKFELFQSEAPKATENFRQFCTGKVLYINRAFHIYSYSIH